MSRQGSPEAGSLGVERMCVLAGVSRAGYYRRLADREPKEEEMEVRSALQRIVLEHRRRYGYRRVARELRRQGMAVNHKRVARLMREDNLLAVEPRAFVATTDSNHPCTVHLNLARRLELTGIDQLWVADITYIRLRSEFVYLAVVLDAFSRKVVGWALERTLAARLATAALEQAIATRQPRPGLVHHSDRGLQYASRDYTELLAAHGMTASMSRPANPYDNAHCESFIKTLKQEEIYANPYRDLEQLRGQVAEFLDQYYNRARLHSALGYRTPEEYERQLGHSSPGAPKMSFLRHEEVFRSDGDKNKTGAKAATQTPALAADPHRLDETPVGYSSAGWSPPEPTSASPTNNSLQPDRLT
jgi:transposase InsO family protein